MLKSISYIVHPLFMPLLCVLFYFSKSPRYIPFEIIKYKSLNIFILTILLPLLISVVLKMMGKIESIHLKTTKERILPLLIYTGIIVLIIKRVLPPQEFLELYYFFIGILLSSLSAILLLLFKFKSSLHMMAISGLFMFVIALSIHYRINILGSIILIVILMGAVASSRLALKAHNSQELIMGICLGLIPQLILIRYWL